VGALARQILALFSAEVAVVDDGVVEQASHQRESQTPIPGFLRFGGLLLDEGLEAAFDRHARLGRACREGAKAMGLELFSPDEERSAVVTAIRAPDGVDATDIVATLNSRFGITIANGQGELKGRIFRIGHIGWFDVFDITTALAAVELALADAGADIERGVAVTRALEAWAEHTPV